jgi:2'-5' RNA ligase
MRLFTAIELSDTARQAMSLVQQQVVRTLRGSGKLRLVKPEQQHLTLVFIGEVAEDRGGRIALAMSREIPLAPFRITFRQIDAFPSRGAPRVLVLAAEEGTERAVDLQHYVADRLEGEGVGREQRPFRPHLTLGRWRDSRPSDRPSSEIQGAIEVDVDRVTLFQSRLSPAGPSYTRLATARLICP